MLDLRFVKKTILPSMCSQPTRLTEVLSTCLNTKIITFSKKIKFLILAYAFAIVCAAAPQSHAVLLEGWIFNVDGTVSDSLYGDPMPATGSLDNGFGSLSLEITGQGTHSVLGQFDFEILEAANTWYNEYGLATGTPGVGQSWEIDEPGWGNRFYYGDIVDNAYAGGLDNTNALPLGGMVGDDDMSFGLGWDFALLDGDVATIDFIFSEELPTVDFYLTQIDPDAAYQFYFYSQLTIESAGGPQGPTPDPNPGPAPVPEPGTAMLLLAGLTTAWSQRRKISAVGKR